MRKTLIFTLWAILFLAIAGVALIFTAIAKGKIGYVPPVEELENPNLKFATQIISDRLQYNQIDQIHRGVSFVLPLRGVSQRDFPYKL